MSVHFRWVSPLNFYSPIFTLYLVLYGDNSQFKVIKAQKSFSNGLLGSGKVKVEKEKKKKKKILKIPTRWAFLLPWVNWEKVHKNSIIVPIHSALFSLLLAFRVHSLERTKVILAFRSFLLLFIFHSPLILRCARRANNNFSFTFSIIGVKYLGILWPLFLFCFHCVFFVLPIPRIATSLRANPANWHIERELGRTHNTCTDIVKRDLRKRIQSSIKSIC